VDQQDLPVLLDSAVLRVLREQVGCRDLQDQRALRDSAVLRVLREQVGYLDRRVLPVLAD